MARYNKLSLADGELSLWKLLGGRTGILALAVLLIAINRAAGLVWPYLSKYLVDYVIARRSGSNLVLLVATGLLATVVQAFTAYLIARTVNVSAQRLVADLRKRVQNHVARLPLPFYDSTTTGSLVSRVMNDVEGLRNLLGAGFVSFLGATLTAAIAFAALIAINATMTLVVFAVLLPFGFVLQRALRKYRPIFKEVNIIRAEV